MSSERQIVSAKPVVLASRPVDAPPPAQQQAQGAPVVVMFSMPAALANPKVWAAGFAAIIALIVGLFAIFGGDGGQAVIDAKEAHIQSLERVTERMAEVAESAVSVPPAEALVVADPIGGIIQALGIAILISVSTLMFLLWASER